MIRDLTAKISLPPGLRMAETEPPTALGVPVPIRCRARWPARHERRFDLFWWPRPKASPALVEGLTQGSHIVQFELDGLLDGLPGNVTRRVKGTARGAVVVRDATLGVTITHPDAARANEQYFAAAHLSRRARTCWWSIWPSPAWLACALWRPEVGIEHHHLPDPFAR